MSTTRSQTANAGKSEPVAATSKSGNKETAVSTKTAPATGTSIKPTANDAAASNELLIQIMHGLAAIKSSVDQIDIDNKQNKAEVQELRQQILALSTLEVTPESSQESSPPAHVTFAADQQPRVHTPGENASSLQRQTTPMPASVQQSSNEYVGLPLPPYSTPYSANIAQNTLTTSSFRRQNSTYVEDMGTKMYPLPVFTGKPEDWPLFLVSFNDTNQEFGYSNRQNLMRLQKALQGDAKQVVASLLIYPDNVPQIMEELRFNFGRPETLVRSQIQQLQHVPVITENNADGIIHLSNKVRNIVALFKAAECNEQLMNPMLLEQLLAKLPRSKQFEWAKHAASIGSYATVEHFSNWISELAKIVCFMPAITTMRQCGNSSLTATQPNTHTKRMLHTSYANNANKSCMCCKGSHTVMDCEKFKSLNVNERWEQVKKQKLCISCLKPGHRLVDCHSKKSCNINECLRAHHELLHESKAHTSVGKSSSQISRVYNMCSASEKGQLFRILPVKIRGPNGCISVYAMFDEGSSITLLEDQIACQLGLRGQSSFLSLQWYNDQIKTETSRRVCLEIAGAAENATYYAMKNVRTVKKLSLPQQTFVKDNFANLNTLPMANYIDVIPVLLIGLDNSHLGLPRSVVDSGDSLPVATETKLGWVAYGPTNESTDNQVRVCHAREIQPMKQMLSLMEDYFSIENNGVQGTVTSESDESLRAKKILSETTKKINKRYEVGLLWRDDNVRLPSSFDMAKNRLIKVENKMQKSPAYAIKYCQEIQKYIDKNYARRLNDNELKLQVENIWYLPHFGVENPNKPDKLRIVFDAAAVVSNISLNHCLMKGTEQAKPMMNILMKFRENVIGVAGDIQEMFSQVNIKPSDQHAQRFLWRNGNQSEPIQHFVMTSMIFGATCSPCCAEHVKNVNAQDHIMTMPHGADAVINNMYVDDLVVSFPDINTACEVVSQAITINAEAGFNLRSIVSNSVHVERQFNVNSDEKDSDIRREFEHVKQSERILGLFWNKADDTFGFRLKFHKIRQEVLDDVRPPTKREMLGIVMAIFDPLGFLANITVTPKILMQQTWKLNLSWDAPLPLDIYNKWRSWWAEFKNVQHFSIPRCYTPLLHNAEDVQLHIFVDASVNAYAAVAYLRVCKNSEIEVALVAAKSRVAPTKTTTIPRLELQAALLGARLKHSLVCGHSLNIKSTTFWSDAKTVVLWIRSTKRDYEQFVGTRIAEILTHSEVKDWRWLPTTLNVADEATRTASKINTTADSRWLKGPEFLRLPESNWPNEDALHMAMPSESITAEFLLITKEQVSSIIKFTEFSSFYKLQKHVAWIFRFISNSKGSSLKNCFLTSTELELAKKRICLWVQQEAFAEDMKFLVKGHKTSKSSDLYQLTPFLDEDGLIKVQGRLDKANYLPAAFKRPIIMPNNHHVTNLIMRDYHEKMHHQNNDLTINEMRQQYWVPRIKSLLKNVQRCCSSCVMEKAKPAMPLMGQLPEDRVTPFLRPFSYTGVDFCGPFHVAIGRRNEKRWIAVFTCLNSRAIHLEVATDLSADAFLICFRNFVNRRGTPVRMRSDNGTNFIKANKELTIESRLFDVNEIQQTMSKNNIEWIFNCPSNPHAGGCWERLIKIIKRLIRQILKDEVPQLPTFNCVLIEIENIINSRPLTDLPINVDEEEPLTPNHFLLGCLNSTQTPANNEQPCMRKQWRIAQNLKDRLWKRWTLEYLPQLLLRPKWFEKVTPLNEDQLVMIIDHTLPRSQWKIGRIKKVFTGNDGQVRAAEVQTSAGVFKRPSVKLAILTFGESFSKDARGVGCKASPGNATR